MSKLDGFITKQTRSCLKNSLYWLLVIPLFAACSGGGAAAPAASSTTGSSSTTTTTATITMSAMTFGANPLAAFGTTSVSVNVLSNGTLTTTPVTVNFSSPCATATKANLTASTTTVNGVASVSYVDNACGGSDVVTASITGGPTASGTLTVTPPSSGSITSVSASPTTINLRGTGSTETSTVLFKVYDTVGNAIGGKTVNFSLNTTVGGITLSSPSSITDANGQVAVVVTAGTVSTPVRVTATTVTNAGVTLSTQSSQLIISTGSPDQDSFSLSVTSKNPEGWNYDGEKTTFTIYVADHFNNPVPDGTPISFTTEGGSIQPSCTTVAGSCSVTWTSTNPRPTNATAPDRAGLATITATTIGEESFTDSNGDGYFDSNDFAVFSLDPSLDLPEAWRDDNSNGVHDVNEPFIDFNTDTTYNAANGIYNGILCTDAGVLSGVCTKATLSVRASYILSMSGSDAYTNFFAEDAITPIQVVCMRDFLPGWADVNADGCPDTPGEAAGASCSDVARFWVEVKDLNGNTLPKGTTISASSSLGSMLGTSSYTVDDRTDPFFAKFSTQEVCGGVSEADMELVVTTPKGIKTITTFKILDDG